MSSDSEKIGDRLWNIGNATTAFSAVQFVTLFFAAAGAEFRHSIAAPGVRPTIVIFILLLAGAQIRAIHWCNRYLAKLERSPNEQLNRILHSVGHARIVTVILFTLLGILVLFIGPFSQWMSKPTAAS